MSFDISLMIIFLVCTFDQGVVAVDDVIRLYDGGSANTSEGLVQVYVSRVWKAICYDGWDVLDATVACRQLGITDGYAMPWQKDWHSHWYEATDSPVPSNIVEGNYFSCNGDEESLLSCGYTKDQYCSSHAGVACGVTAAKYNDLMAVHLRRRDTPRDYTIASSGLVVASFRKSYGSFEETLLAGGICDMDEQAAKLICYDQGYINGGKKTKVLAIEGISMMVSKMECGSISYLYDCHLQYTTTGECPDGIQFNGVECYTTVRPFVIGVLLFAGVSSICIFIAGACGIHKIRKDRKIPHVTLGRENDDDVTRDHSIHLSSDT